MDINLSIIDASQEYVTISNILYKISNGCNIPVTELSSEFSNLLGEKLKSDKAALQGLVKLGILDESHAIRKYYDCNYSSFDGIPDISVDGQLGSREYVFCSSRGNCPGENLICRFPGDLSHQQVEVAKRIAMGQMDAQICSELTIAQDTLRNHKNNIEKKIGVTGKTAIAVWAVRNKLV